ncbi:MAG TPA: hypothetical protein EYP53_02735 [Candidatus Latescibacteria bacterium]|nr:hypothetical protein [Candidatus Latescibacterota bacterium]
MRQISRLRWPLGFITVIAFTGVTLSGRMGEGKVQVSGKGKREIVVTIGPEDRSVLAVGDSLRRQGDFLQAIEAYRSIASDERYPRSIRAEATYDVGLSYMWMGRYEEADVWFTQLEAQFPEDGTATSSTEYALAHIDIAKGRYESALSRCRKILKKRASSDPQIYAYAAYQIGRINLFFLHNLKEAKGWLRMVLRDHPGTEPAWLAHIFLNEMEVLED